MNDALIALIATGLILLAGMAILGWYTTTVFTIALALFVMWLLVRNWDETKKEDIDLKKPAIK